VRTSLAQLLRQVAEFVTSPGAEKREKVTAQFDATQRLAELATLELDRHDPEEIARKRQFDDLLGEAQTIFLPRRQPSPALNCRNGLRSANAYGPKPKHSVPPPDHSSSRPYWCCSATCSARRR